MEQAVERGLDWVGVAYSTPILARPRSPHWRRLSDVNGGARFPPAPSVAQSERLIVTPGPSCQGRIAPLRDPSPHHRAGTYTFQDTPMSYWTARVVGVRPVTALPSAVPAGAGCGRSNACERSHDASPPRWPDAQS